MASCRRFGPQVRHRAGHERAWARIVGWLPFRAPLRAPFAQKRSPGVTRFRQQRLCPAMAERGPTVRTWRKLASGAALARRVRRWQITPRESRAAHIPGRPVRGLGPDSGRRAVRRPYSEMPGLQPRPSGRTATTALSTTRTRLRRSACSVCRPWRTVSRETHSLENVLDPQAVMLCWDVSIAGHGGHPHPWATHFLRGQRSLARQRQNAARLNITHS